MQLTLTTYDNQQPLTFGWSRRPCYGVFFVAAKLPRAGTRWGSSGDPLCKRNWVLAWIRHGSFRFLWVALLPSISSMSGGCWLEGLHPSKRRDFFFFFLTQVFHLGPLDGVSSRARIYPRMLAGQDAPDEARVGPRKGEQVGVLMRR
jgi:hypothetical protein